GGSADERPDRARSEKQTDEHPAVLRIKVPDSREVEGDEAGRAHGDPGPQNHEDDQQDEDALRDILRLRSRRDAVRGSWRGGRPRPFQGLALPRADDLPEEDGRRDTEGHEIAHPAYTGMAERQRRRRRAQTVPDVSSNGEIRHPRRPPGPRGQPGKPIPFGV